MTKIQLPRALDCPLSKGNLKCERPNGKILKSNFLLTASVKNWCVQLTWMSMKRFFRRFVSNQNKWKSMTFLVILHLKPIPLLQFSVKCDIFKSAFWVLWVVKNNFFTKYSSGIGCKTMKNVIDFHLFWFESNLWRNRFIELSSDLDAPRSKNFGF